MNPSTDRKLILSTDYGLDKILDTFTGSFFAGARLALFSPRMSTASFTHTAGTYCLINGAYSFNNSTWYPFGVSVADTSDSIPTFQTVEVNAYSNDSQIVVQASNWTGSNQTIYYALQILSRD